jgi:NAD-dependent deacetylase
LGEYYSVKNLHEVAAIILLSEGGGIELPRTDFPAGGTFTGGTSPKAYVLTGAGISTESGIPDFRSPQTGLWTKVDPMKKATASFLNNDPDEFWRMNLSRYRQIYAENAQPNMGHKVLARLEESGFIRGIITQNIDRLHHKAGSKKVWELHGHVRTVRCYYAA